MRSWRNEREMESHATGESKARSRVNTCPRCGGHMTLEDFVDYGGTYQPSGSVAWRCMNCGNRVDELILQDLINSPRVELPELYAENYCFEHIIGDTHSGWVCIEENL